MSRPMRPGSLYRAVTGRYTYVDIGLEGLTPAEAAAHVAEVRLAMAAQGLLVDGERSLPVPVLPPPAEVAPEPVDSAAASGTMTGALGAVTMSTTTTLTPHQQRTKEADAAAAAKAVPPPVIPGPPAPPAAPRMPSPDTLLGRLRVAQRKDKGARLVKAWLAHRDLKAISALDETGARALMEYLVANGMQV